MWIALLVPVLAGVFFVVMERLETGLLGVAQSEEADGVSCVPARLHARRAG